MLGFPHERSDRYVVKHGKIAQMEAWNDSAEWLLVRAGLVKP